MPIEFQTPSALSNGITRESVIVAALLTMLGDDEITLDEIDVDQAIKTLQHKELTLTQLEYPRVLIIKLEERT